MGASQDSPKASLLAALAQPTRLRIIEVIAAGDPEGTAAGVIAKRVDCPASTLSFHLKELAQAGFLEARPRGRFILYAMVPGSFAALAEFIARLPGEPPATSTPPRPRGRGAKGRRDDKPKPADADTQLSIF